MGSEVLLYGYGIVCLSMLAFNIVYNMGLKQKDRRMEGKSRRFAEKIDAQMERLRTGKKIEETHFSYLRRKLSRVNNLIAFDRVMEERLAAGDDLAVEEYRRQMQPVMLHLAMIYRNRDNMQAAYFAYFLSKNNIKKHQRVSTVQKLLVEFMEKDSLYCRVNALQALCSFGSPESILEAVILLDSSEGFFHEKILTDGLLSFGGSHEQLIQLLWERFASFTNRTKLAVLNYIRFKTGDYCEQMLAIMMNPGEEKELRLSAIRYFGRYFYEPAKDALLAFAFDENPINWEYAAVSVTALSRYRGSDVLAALMAAVHSSNWHVRSNAAASLEAHDLDYSDLIEVVGGKDRYAREMMMYQLDSRRMEQRDQEAAI